MAAQGEPALWWHHNDGIPSQKIENYAEVFLGWCPREGLQSCLFWVAFSFLSPFKKGGKEEVTHSGTCSLQISVELSAFEALGFTTFHSATYQRGRVPLPEMPLSSNKWRRGWPSSDGGGRLVVPPLQGVAQGHLPL